MLVELYGEIGKWFLFGGVLLFIFVLVNLGIRYALSFIDDAKFKPSDSITTFIVKLVGDKSEQRWISDGDTSAIGFILFKIGAGTFIIVLAWPIVSFVGAIYLILLLLRSLKRLKKKVFKISKIAHTHLDKVNIEEFKEEKEQ